MTEIQESIIRFALESIKKSRKETDYTDRDGQLRCGICNKNKTFSKLIDGKAHLFPSLCDCEKAERERELAYYEALERQIRIENLEKEGIVDRVYRNCSFDADDGRNKEASKIAKRYAENFLTMKATNTGLIFYGGVGTGKSFLSACIVHELIQRQIRAKITSIPKLINELQETFEGRNRIIAELGHYDLLVLDDLGTERHTEYGIEQLYAIIDSRYKSKKPLIISTNLTFKEMQETSSIDLKRIYDRILEMCTIPVQLNSKSRRAEIADEKRRNAIRILFSD